MCSMELGFKGVLCTHLGSRGFAETRVFLVHWPEGYAMLMNPNNCNKGQTAFHCCHCLVVMVVKMRRLVYVFPLLVLFSK